MKQQKQEGHSALLPPPLFPESESPWNFPGQDTGVGSLCLPPGEGNGDPLQYACLENPMDRGS